MTTEELLTELKLSIHEGITALDPLAKELLREYKMQQLVYAVIYGIATIIFGFIVYKIAKRYIINEYVESAIESILLIIIPILLLVSFGFMVESIINYVSPILSLMQSLTDN